ncbi:MAG: hypothetical protein AAF531_11955 [Actinomycetota bacterium]
MGLFLHDYFLADDDQRAVDDAFSIPRVANPFVGGSGTLGPVEQIGLIEDLVNASCSNESGERITLQVLQTDPESGSPVVIKLRAELLAALAAASEQELLRSANAYSSRVSGLIDGLDAREFIAGLNSPVSPSRAGVTSIVMSSDDADRRAVGQAPRRWMTALVPILLGVGCGPAVSTGVAPDGGEPVTTLAGEGLGDELADALVEELRGRFLSIGRGADDVEVVLHPTRRHWRLNCKSATATRSH